MHNLMQMPLVAMIRQDQLFYSNMDTTTTYEHNILPIIWRMTILTQHHQMENTKFD